MKHGNELTKSGKLSSRVIPSAATVLDVQRSPDSERLRGALLGIKAPGAKIIRKMSTSGFLFFFLDCMFLQTVNVGVLSVADHTALNVTVYKPQISSFNDLLTDKASQLLLDPTSSIYSAVRTSISYSSKAEIHYGIFKLAFAGNSTTPVFRNLNSESPGGESICLKQKYYMSAQSGKRKPYDAATQVSSLIIDICSLVWADQLMRLVYRFIENHDHATQPEAAAVSISSSKKDSRPLVPALHFTSSGLACSDDRNTIYLVEELIDANVEGRYVKYVSNASPKPLSFLPGDKYINVANFLCFSQHVQYMTTKLAYVSDFQGKVQIFPFNSLTLLSL